jgi:hypothetical protein
MGAQVYKAPDVFGMNFNIMSLGAAANSTPGTVKRLLISCNYILVQLKHPLTGKGTLKAYNAITVQAAHNLRYIIL